MDQPGDEDAGFGVELEWPVEVGDAPLRPSPRAPDSTPSSGPDDVAGPASGDRPAPAPLLPAIANRIDSVEGSITVLSTRLDSLVAATNSLRSLLSDRLSEYAEAVATYAADIDEQRQASERLTEELRGAMAETDEAVRQMIATVEAATTAGPSGSAPADLTAIKREISRLRSLQGDLAAVAALPDEVAALRDGLAGFIEAAGSFGGNGAAGGEMTSAFAELRDDLAAVRAEVVQLKRRVGVKARAASVLTGDDHGAIAEAVAYRLGASGPSLSEDQLEWIVRSVVQRLEEAFEVVREDEPPPAQPAPAPAPKVEPAPAPSRRGRRR